LLLDLGLPKKAGLDVLRALRRDGETIPVIILTARDAVADRIKGLDMGADDYVVKPFDLTELAARVRALLRRRAGRSDIAMKVGPVTLVPATREVECGGKSVSLSPREFTLLEALMDRPGVVLSRQHLEEKLYGWGEEVESNTVEVYIHGLRKKLGQRFIRNIRGVGYMVPRQ
jgi:two-component system response regulator QseB